MRSALRPPLAVALLLWSPQALVAQSRATCAPDPNPWVYLERCGQTLIPGDTTTLPEAFKQAFTNLKSPATLNSALGELTSTSGRFDLRKDLNVHAVNVQEGSTQNLGLHCDWKRDLARSPHRQGTAHWAAPSA